LTALDFLPLCLIIVYDINRLVKRKSLGKNNMMQSLTP